MSANGVITGLGNQRRLSRHEAMFCSSLKQMTIAETVARFSAINPAPL